MKNTQPPISLQEIKKLRLIFKELFDEDLEPKKEADFDNKFQTFKNLIEDAGITVDDPRQIERILEGWYEWYSKTSSVPEGESSTTLNPEQLAVLQQQAEKKSQQKADIRSRERRLIENYIKQNEERIAKSKSLQGNLKGKNIYAKVDIFESEKLTQNEQQAYEALLDKAKKETPIQGKTLSPKQELIEEFTIEIEKKLEPILKDLPENEREVVARTYAVEIVEKIVSPKTVTEERIQTVILDNIAKPKQEVVAKVLMKEDELITLAKNGAVLIATKQKDNFSNLEVITANILGPKIASKILGFQNYQITFSEKQIQGETTHNIQFEELNQNQIHILTKENEMLQMLLQHGEQVGYDKINSFFINYLGKSSERNLNKAPARDFVTQNVFARFGMNKPLVWINTTQNEFNDLITSVSSKTVRPILNLATKTLNQEFVKPIISTITKTVSEKITGKLTEQVVVKTGFGLAIKSFFSNLGAAVGPVGLAATKIAVAIVSAIGKVINWPKVKQWFYDNKEVFVVGGVGFGLVFGGPVAAVFTGVLLMAATGTFSFFAAGALSVFGFIGRSIGIAIATPIIITLLVIPPLVAFIMLVINNSAYVVPPDARSLGLNLDNPYVLVTKVANPEKFENPTSNKVIVTYTVTIKALKSPLTKISITDATCKVSKKNTSTIQDCPPELENIPPLPADLNISPSNSYSFTFTSEFDSKYADSSIFDTIKIKATAEEKEIETSGSESVCIGDCPHGCFEISDDNEPWPDFGPKLEGATQRLTSEFPSFVDEACMGREKVKLCYTTSNPTPNGERGLCNGAIYAITSTVGNDEDKCVINFNQCVFESDKTDSDVFFLLTHELSHHVQNNDGGHMINKYESAGGQYELPLCSYSNTIDNEGNANTYEGSAEANALYANNGVASFSTCGGPINFQSQYPNNYGFAQSYMNNP